jgi:hypothetical protein
VDALIGLGRYEDAIKQIDSMRTNDDQKFKELDRAEFLLRAGRTEEARAAAAQFAAFQEAIINKAKSAGASVLMGYFRMGKALEILGRQTEAAQMIDHWSKLDFIPEPLQDPWVFRNNPAALASIASVRERGGLTAKRIREIEESYQQSGLAPGTLK